MRSRTSQLMRTVAVVVAATVAFGSMAQVADAASSSLSVKRHKARGGDCRGPGSADWEVSVRRESGGRLRVDFRVDDIRRGPRWQVFVADNGGRVAAVTRHADRTGDFKIRRLTRNRRGHDRIRASAVNLRTGVTCNGRMRF